MRWAVFKKLIMVDQTLFGLPWAVIGAVLPFADPAFANSFNWSTFGLKSVWIVLGFCFARVAGMSFNRLIDRHIDADNPRTKDRSIPKGEVSPRQVMLLAWGSVIGGVVVAGLINNICLALSPFIILLLWGYSYTKRFTMLCHFVLGLIEFFAPFCAWIAITDSLAWPPVLLGVAALASLAGMDVIYQIQDHVFDTGQKLRSIPVVLGAQGALWVARRSHVVAVAALIWAGVLMGLSAVYFIGVGVVASLYIHYHRKIKPKALDAIPQVFFSCNTWVGLTMMAADIGVISFS